MRMNAVAVLILILSLIPAASAQVSIEPSKTYLTMFSEDTDLGNGKHTLTLHSGPQRAMIDGRWQEAVQTNYTNGTWIIYTELDEKTMLTVPYCTEKDGCYVCRTVSNEMLGKTVPIYKDGIEASRVVYDPRDKACNLETATTIKFGEESTTIKITYGNTTDDAPVWQAYPNTNYGSLGYSDIVNSSIYQMNELTRFNISAIPEGKVIELAYFAKQIYAGYMEAGEWMTFCVHHVSDYPLYNISELEWTEENVAWANRSITSAQYNKTAEYCLNVTSDYTDLTWSNLTVTDALKTSYDAGFKNTSFYIIPISFNMNDIFNDAPRLYTKETVTKEPYLYVTYTEGAADTEPPDINYTAPTLGNNSYTLNHSWLYVNVTLDEAGDGCLLYNMTGNMSMTNSGDNLYSFINWTGLANNTRYCYYAYCQDLAGNDNVTEMWCGNINLTSYGCTPSIANTTIVNVNNASCNTSDLFTYNWSWTQWDTAVCGSFANITWVFNNYTACNNCSYNITNSSVTGPANTTPYQTNGSCNTSGNIEWSTWNWTQWSWWIQYDTNQSTCCGITGIGTDCFTNITWYDNTSWGNYTFNLNCTYTPKAYCTIVPYFLIFEDEREILKIALKLEC